MVEEDIRLLQVFPEPPLVCYRRARNIRDMICQARVPPVRQRRQDCGFKRCMKPRCRLCPYTGLKPGEVVKNVKISHSGEEVPV